MAYSKSSPNNKFAPSTVVSMASRTSNRPMSYGQVYENLNYEMGMHKISDTDRKWMACRKNFINSNKRAFEELQIKVGKLIEAGKIPPNYANNLDKICTEDEFNEIQAEVNRMESSRAIDRTGHFRAGSKEDPADAASAEKQASPGTQEKPAEAASAEKQASPDTQEKLADAATVVTDSEDEGESDTNTNKPNPTNKIKKLRKKRELSDKQKDKIQAKNQEKLNEKQKNLADKIKFEKRFNEQADAKKTAKDAKNIAKINFKNAKRDFDENQNQEKKDIMETAEQKLNEASEAYKKLTETFNDKVWDEVDKKIDERKTKTKRDAITEDVKILTEANNILLKNVPETNVIKKLAKIKNDKIVKKKKNPSQKNKNEVTEKQKLKILEKRTKDESTNKLIDETERIEVEAAKKLAVKDGLLIRTEKGKYIPNINKNDIGTLRKVKKGIKDFTISGHTADDITTVGKNKYVLRKNKNRAAKNYWSKSLKTSLKISDINSEKNVKMVGPAEFEEKYKKANDEQKKKLVQNLKNYETVMTEYLKLIKNDEDEKYNEAEKKVKVEKTEQKLKDAKELFNKYNTQSALQAATEVDYTAQKRADAQRISAMDRDYRQSFQAAYQQKPFKADRYKLGSSDMHDWPSSAGSSVSSNRDSWYAEWNANRSY